MSTKTMRPPPRRVLTASLSSAGSSYTNPNITTTDKNVNNNNNIIINISNKRKERGEGFPIDPIKSKSSTMLAAATDTTSRIFKHKAPNLVGPKPGPDSGQPLTDHKSNQLLLAGYMAHEVLSKGTMFGQAWDPTRSEPNHCNLNASVSSERRCAKQLGYNAGEEAKPKPLTAPVVQQRGKESEEEEGRGRYKEVANLLMSGGAHFPGIVNPSQLGRFLQL